MKQRSRQPKPGWLVHGGVLLAGLLGNGHALAQSGPATNGGPVCMDGLPANAVVVSPRQDRCPTMPKGAIPLPVGSHVRGFQDAQTAKAEADDFVFYKLEWYLGGKDLGPYGRYHLTEVMKRLRKVPFPIVIQPAFDRELNEIRRQLIVQYLKVNDVPDAELRVLVAFPEAEGIAGEEAERIFLQAIGTGRGIGGVGDSLSAFGGIRGGFPSFGISGGVGAIGAGGFRGF